MEYNIFKRKVPNIQKLIEFGFLNKDGKLTYKKEILDGQFSISIEITDGNIETKTIDLSTGDLYTMHLVEGTQGAFVGSVREEFNALLQEIADKCFDPDVFKSKTAHSVINFVRNKYGVELEFLWEKFPDCAVFRRKDTNKWFGILLVISKKKLGLNSDEIIDVIDLRIDTNKLEIIDNKHIFPGYHMNKKHWITIPLDSTVTEEEIFKYIEQSFDLAK